MQLRDARRIGAAISTVWLTACGDAGEGVSALRTGPLSVAQTAAVHAPPDVRFDGSLVKAPFIPRRAIWGIESHGSVASHNPRAYRTQDLVVLLSNSDDPCANYPHGIASDGHMAFIVRMSKLVRHAGSAVFVEPDAGTYNVEQPHGAAPAVSRGAELVFRANTVQHGETQTWLGSDGSVELTERSSTSDVVRGTFTGTMVPFALEEEPTGPFRPISGDFVAQRCKKMDET